jgi:transcriptional pleiotropic repressor
MEKTADEKRFDVAWDRLTYSEQLVMARLAPAMESEGPVVISRVCDGLNITRSVGVAAIRKFEFAGLIESRSLGGKGTHLKPLWSGLPGALAAKAAA